LAFCRCCLALSIYCGLILGRSFTLLFLFYFLDGLHFFLSFLTWNFFLNLSLKRYVILLSYKLMLRSHGNWVFKILQHLLWRVLFDSTMI
jgi:hypothetical protein